MTLFSSREDFYSALWEDYLGYVNIKETDNSKFRLRSAGSDVSQCFYYRFIKNKKDTAAEEIAVSEKQLTEYSKKPKIDKYILLHGAYIAFNRNKTITEKKYRDIFTSLAGTQKSGKKYLTLLEMNITAATEQLEFDLLSGCVRDFFDNEGFNINTFFSGGDFKLASRHRKKKQGYNDIVEMIYLYMHENDISDSNCGGTADISDEYIEKCSVLYSAALREKHSKAFIPLYFDHVSGAGIFIVGKSRFVKENRPSSECVVCIIRFEFLELERGDNISEWNEISFVMMTSEPYETVREAFSEFLKGTASGEYIENYAEINCPDPDKEYFCPEDADDIFISRLKCERERGMSEKGHVKPTKSEKIIMDKNAAEEERHFAILREKHL